MKAKERLQNTRFRDRVVYMNIIFCPMPLRTGSIIKHDCGTAGAAFLSRTFGGPGILQFSRLLNHCFEIFTEICQESIHVSFGCFLLTSFLFCLHTQ